MNTIKTYNDINERGVTMGKYVDRTGMRYGRLTVLKEAEPTYTKSKTLLRRWVCKCDCGNTIIVYASNLTSGHSTQCKECGIKQSSSARIKHGLRKSRLYGVWSSMKSRCYCKGSSSYNRYGKIGITVCDEWICDNGFENFAKWAFEHGFVEDAKDYENTLDRIDATKAYSPDNCRFVNAYTQSNNRTYCIVITDKDGEVLTLKQLARKYDISYGTMHTRWSRGLRTLEELTKLTVGRSGKRVAHFSEYSV
jgi:hypothetical protein